MINEQLGKEFVHCFILHCSLIWVVDTLWICGFQTVDYSLKSVDGCGYFDHNLCICFGKLWVGC